LTNDAARLMVSDKPPYGGAIEIVRMYYRSGPVLPEIRIQKAYKYVRTSLSTRHLSDYNMLFIKLGKIWLETQQNPPHYADKLKQAVATK
jgi:hypothetical protein